MDNYGLQRDEEDRRKKIAEMQENCYKRYSFQLPRKSIFTDEEEIV